MIGRAGWLPPGAEPREREESFGKRRLLVPDLAPVEIHALLGRLRRRAETLPARDDRIAAIARAALRFLDPADPLARRAADLLPGVTGFSPEMIREVLPRIFAALDEATLGGIVAEARGAVHPLVAIVAAGNVPGVALPKMALALAAGSACLVKCAQGEPVLAPLFAAALAAESAALGSATAVAWWKGGANAWEEEVQRTADSLIAYGSDEAIAGIARRAPATFVAHGHRLSIALVDLARAVTVEPIAEAAALDVTLYDQLGCLSPQCIYVTGGDAAGRAAFVAALARSLERLARLLPRGEAPAEASAAIRRVRDEIEWRELAGEPVRVLASDTGTTWTVIEEASEGFRPSPLYRTIFVRPLARAEGLRAALGAALRRVECAGVAPWPHEEIASALAASGIANVVPLGRMQSPTLRWRQGGNPPLAGIERTSA